jgi:hypothetical protein
MGKKSRGGRFSGPGEYISRSSIADGQVGIPADGRQARAKAAMVSARLKSQADSFETQQGGTERYQNHAGRGSIPEMIFEVMVVNRGMKGSVNSERARGNRRGRGSMPVEHERKAEVAAGC